MRLLVPFSIACLISAIDAYLIGALGQSHQLFGMDKTSAIKYCKAIQVACLNSWLPEEVVTEHGHAKTWILENLKDDDVRTSVVFDTSKKAMCHLVLYRVSESKSPPIVSLHAIIPEPFNRHNLSQREVISALDGFCNTKKLYLQHQELSTWHTWKTRTFLESCVDADS